MSTNLIDNTKAVLEALDKQIERALIAVGHAAESNAKQHITDMKAVDTGRLRGSITWATRSNEGKEYTYKDKDGKQFSDKIGKGAEKNAVYIGTNVEYAPYIELGSSGRSPRPFLKKASTEHSEEYKKLVKEALEK